VNVHNGAKESPSASLSVDVQHTQYLQEPHPAVIQKHAPTTSASSHQHSLITAVFFLPRDPRSAKRGTATVSCPSVCPSVR